MEKTCQECKVHTADTWNCPQCDLKAVICNMCNEDDDFVCCSCKKTFCCARCAEWESSQLICAKCSTSSKKKRCCLSCLVAHEAVEDVTTQYDFLMLQKAHNLAALTRG